jgi:predicted metal-dependent enzyme (double-stranded beta helix superfamily)
MFDLDQFIADVRATLGDRSRQGTREVVARAVSDSDALLRCLGEPNHAGIQVLHHAPDLTILNLSWGPRQMTTPHDHRMWAVIVMYGGREDNMYWRRVPDPADRQIELAGGKALCRGDVEVLGQDIIHSVVNPLGKISAAIHVYGGDLLTIRRSQWEPESLAEQPFDIQQARLAFDAANALLDRT